MNQNLIDKNRAVLDTLVGSVFTRRMLEMLDRPSRKSIFERFIEIADDQKRRYKTNPARVITLNNLAAGTRTFGHIRAEIKMPSAKQATTGRPPVLEIRAMLNGDKGPVLEMKDHMAVYLPAIPESAKASITRMPLTKLVDCDILADIVVTSVGVDTWRDKALALRLSPQKLEPVAPILLSDIDVAPVSARDFVLGLQARGITTIDRALTAAFNRVKDYATLLARFEIQQAADFSDLVVFKRPDAVFKIIVMGEGHIGLSYDGGHMRFRGQTLSWDGTQRGFRYFESGLFDQFHSRTRHYRSDCSRPIAIEKLLAPDKSNVFGWY